MAHIYILFLVRITWKIWGIDLLLLRKSRGIGVIRFSIQLYGMSHSGSRWIIANPHDILIDLYDSIISLYDSIISPHDSNICLDDSMISLHGSIFGLDDSMINSYDFIIDPDDFMTSSDECVTGSWDRPDGFMIVIWDDKKWYDM